MAGLAKPNVYNLGKEVEIIVLESKLFTGSDADGLFDGECVNEWNTEKVAYWRESGHYIKILVPKTVNIWRSGTTTWSNNNGLLSIIKIKNNTEIDITNDIVQNTSEITEKEWEKTISELPSGVYKISNNGNFRIDSEWYVEDANDTGVELKFYKTLSSNIQDEIKAGLEEVHFTEKGEIFTYTNDGKKLQLGGSGTSSGLDFATEEW